MKDWSWMQSRSRFRMNPFRPIAVSMDRVFDSQPSSPSEPKTDSNKNVQLQEDVANVDGQPRSSAPSLPSDVRLAETKKSDWTKSTEIAEMAEDADEKALQAEDALGELTEPDGPSEGRMIPPMRPLKLRFPKNNEPFEAVLNDYATQERSVLRYLGIRVFGGLTLSDFQVHQLKTLERSVIISMRVQAQEGALQWISTSKNSNGRWDWVGWIMHSDWSLSRHGKRNS